MSKSLSDVLEYLYKNEQKELAEVVLESMKIKNSPLNTHRQIRPKANPPQSIRGSL